MLELLLGPGLAFALGVRHAFEPDHLAAVSTLVAEPARKRGFSIGTMWGIGHATSLLVVAGLLTFIEGTLSQGAMNRLELLVAVMLVLLGARSILRAARLRKHGPKLAQTPSLLVGAVHGLAGSGALVAVALAAMPTLAGRLVYVLMFGVGSIVGMGLATALASWGIERLGVIRRWERALLAGAGTSSVVIGLWLGAPLLGG